MNAGLGTVAGRGNERLNDLPEAAGPASPPFPVRGERLFECVDRALAWCDGWISRWLPAEHNPLAQAGAAANLALSVAIASGVALLIWYSPSVASAYASIAGLAQHPVGAWVRAVHRYSSDLAMLLVLVHATRVFFARKFTGARWLPWVTGLLLIGLVWFIGWTGYWLVWDQPAQQVAVNSMRLLDALPVFGEPLSRLYVADRLVPSLLFFVVFFLHMLLPLGIAVGLAIHLMRVSRAKLFPHWKLSVALGVGVAVAAALLPAPIDAPAQMMWKAPMFVVDAWYLAPLALALRLQHAGLWVALGAAVAIAAALPWLLGRPRAPGSFQAVVEPGRCHACTQCSQDCPFDAISMVARTDGKNFPAQAWVDPARCVGCGVCAGSCDSEGISIAWFDTRREEARIFAEFTATMTNGGTPWVALVAGDADGAFGFLAAAQWRERLGNYQVHLVPTASWVRPRFVEQLLRSGAKGVMVIRDARAEAAARDGNRWVHARLAGERQPVFRAGRAGGSSAWRVVDFDPSRPHALRRSAEEFQSATPAIPAGAPQSVRGLGRRRFGTGFVVLALALVLGAITVGGSRVRVHNPGSANPEFVFSFRVLGERVEAGVVDAVADAAKPIHMRGRSTAKPHRAPVLVKLSIDGVALERRFRAKGISEDGPALDEWRQPLAPGPHAIAIEILAGATTAFHWSAEIAAQPRRLVVVTFEPDAGFRVE